VHMAGVLHHCTDPVAVMQEVATWLEPGGEVRLMVYSDQGWRLATGTEPPDDVAAHPARTQFVRFMDEVGDWADWYDGPRLAARSGRWFTVKDVRYITPDQRYLTATLVRT
jgi:SAM-dependent methyltransferase